MELVLAAGMLETVVSQQRRVKLLSAAGSKKFFLLFPSGEW